VAQQPVVKVLRRTEGGEAPGWQGATSENGCQRFAPVDTERKRRRRTPLMGATSLKGRHAPAKDGQRLRNNCSGAGLYSFVFRRFKVQYLGVIYVDRPAGNYL
jgi:hypothetical protein